MRLLILPVLFTAALASSAYAEKVRINQAAKVFARTGEHSKVVANLKSGEKVNVIGKEGRWLKVRAQGRTGYIPRTVADVPETEIARNTRRRPFVDGRGTDRGSLGGSASDDRVGADALGDNKGGDDSDDDDKPSKSGKGKPSSKDDDDDDKPSKPGKGKPSSKDDDDDDKPSKGSKDDDDDGDDVKVSDDDEPKRKTVRVAAKTDVHESKDKGSDVMFAATPDDTLYLNGKVGDKWTEVENNEGDIGYVLTSKLDLPDESDIEAMNAPKKREIGLRVRGGLTMVLQGVRTVGGTNTVPDNYNIGAPAVTLGLGGEYLTPYSPKIMLGGDVNYSYARATPGVAYQPMNQAAVTIPFTVHDFDARGIAGYDMHKPNGMMLKARVGFRYYAFLVTDVGNLTKNPAKLPSETRISPALGGGISIPRITPQIGIAANLDLLPMASIKQTKGLEDGNAPKAFGLCLGGVFDYKIKSDMSFTATYDLNYTAASFGAPIMNSRNHTGTAVTRTDVFHMIAVGITKGF